VAIPLSVQLFADIKIPISLVAIVVAFGFPAWWADFRNTAS